MILRNFFVLVIVILLPGCNWDVEKGPRDYFSGSQLFLAEAIERGDTSHVKKLVATTELNKPGKEDMTLLFWALMNTLYDKKTQPRLQIVTELIRAGADPLQPRPNGKSSPAEFVLMADSGEWIKAMLDGGLSPNAKDYVFDKPIIFQSIEAKNTETLKVMLDRGGNINITDSLGNTLLIDAFDFHSYDHVFLLLERGADPDIRADNGWTLGNQLQRFLRKTKKDSDEYKDLIAIKESLIRHGGKWPPEPVKRGIE
ncbi:MULTISPECIES: ankyrin repeat domain-containing protein [Enterobacter]|uniref:ankyrin repeat domain-containing protein n=1 Tax=Enterobacter TaxID=547 RepID=UPI000FEB779E|nr:MULTISPECIES: ankyrin repeat domain-containing protein [Enterobacter]HEO9143299.1 ankyrin repeat domain-containing protein [Enterobacter asburiae]MCR1300505.1 ankyrin repeat domain-containing protein [Enterobacter sp. FL1277]MCR1308440.1 ankyrin repeat domain-containing protein [Enterobacter sp. BT1271]MCR1324852.1 ankyrin repeat domain-containing protein [Enterobacter sp. BT1268]MCR1327282.1 ankyrin repeat domain-containing protein [Enterobacter sp. BT1131]